MLVSFRGCSESSVHLQALIQCSGGSLGILNVVELFIAAIWLCRKSSGRGGGLLRLGEVGYFGTGWEHTNGDERRVSLCTLSCHVTTKPEGVKARKSNARKVGMRHAFYIEAISWRRVFGIVPRQIRASSFLDKLCTNSSTLSRH